MLHPLLEASLKTKYLKVDLERIQLLDRSMGHPSKAFQSIHVGGTNGKGSVCLKIATALEIEGKKVGLYTSPHLFSWRERIQINQVMISEKDADFFLKKILEKSPFQPTYFELLTQLAFTFFAESNIEIAVLEVGLGGRLDPTNIVIPCLSVITSIDIDHTRILGDTLEKIAYEKAGIIKENVPVILGPNVKPLSIFQQVAFEKNAPLKALEGFSIHYEEENQNIAKDALSLLSVKSSSIAQGIKNTPPCRFSIVHKNPTIILDVAHNPAGIAKTLARTRHAFPGKKLYIIAAFSEDKEIGSCLKMMKGTDVVLTQAHHPRAFNAANYPSNFIVEPRFEDAFAMQMGKAKKEDLLLIFGTFFIMPQAVCAAAKLNSELLF